MNGLEGNNEAASSGWMATKKLFLLICVSATVIALMVTGGKFFNYIDALGYWDEKGKLYDLLEWITVTAIVFWILNKVLMMGRVDKISNSMLINGFFNPQNDDHITFIFKGSYFGIDFNTGVVGVAAAYKSHQNDKKITYFEDSVIESYDFEIHESNKQNLVLNLRCRKVPTLTIPVKDGHRMFRKIDQLAQLGSTYSTHRNTEFYQKTKRELIKVGKMIEADY